MSFPLSKSPIFSATFPSKTLRSLPAQSPTTSREASLSKMTSSSCTSARVVTIPYTEIEDRSADLSGKIEDAFGPNGLGILAVSKVPGFATLRRDLLHLSPRLANLPEEVKKELEDPESRYNFGWSHGKEKLESGKPDMLKGSFYANPVLDSPTTDTSLIKRYPSYCQANIWPRDALPELETAFKALGKLMLDVGLLLAYHCDQYVSKRMKIFEDEGLEQILSRSRCHKGRLLYYFPMQQSEGTESVSDLSSWCGWHRDHGSLTGLTCGMFMRDGLEVPCPDNAAGLYIKTRTDQIVKAMFGGDEIAYQIGETTEVLSRGHLCATPHCVRGPKGEKASSIERSTFALFMQPDWDESLNFPEGVHLHQEIIPPNGRLTFGEYSEMLLDKYYHRKQ
ncbi:hypothetical protein Scep_008257 [Stephania cephalantha]|uniref:Non-haem dioxygenase N-terminal domain-containing protein n=1 Tax=Stephania cephalantha TaxID=152367 RepID=A0AAP0PPG9_9MAGN